MNPDIAPPLDTDNLQWSDALKLGHDLMDEAHREFVETVQALSNAADADLLHCLDVFTAHAKAHFAEEDAWMIESEFPPRDCHIDEHAAVMRSVAQVREQVAQGDFSECRRLAAELKRWFPGHVDYLDSALAHWMNKRRFGGKPVILRRDLGVKSTPRVDS